jgi:hypothetical protein
MMRVTAPTCNHGLQHAAGICGSALRETLAMSPDRKTHGNHHFVPELYLKAWATRDESQGRRLTYYRWIQGRLLTSRIAPKGAAAQFDLYATVDKDGSKSQSVEKDYFAREIDDKASPVIAKMLAGDGPLTSGDAAAFARYLLAQRVRTPGYVEHLRCEAALALDDVARSLEADYQKVRHQTAPATMADFFQQSMPHVEHYIGVQSLPRLIDQPRLLADILDFEWAWGPIGSADTALLTSDRPVVFTTGLGNPDCIIALPLSPTVAFFAMKERARLERMLQHPPQDLAARLNYHVLSQAKEYVYAGDDSQRTCVEEHFRPPERQQREVFRRLRPEL